MTYCLTCDYQACEKIKVKDLFAGLNLSDTTCSGMVNRINRILRNFYLDTIDFEQNRVSQEVTCIWDTTINTEFPIYKLRWFYVKVDSNIQCVSMHCITNSTEDEVCRTCTWDPQSTYLLKTFQTKWDRSEWQYTISCDNTIHFNNYSCFDHVFIEYSRWPLTVTSIDDYIQIDSKMLIALEYYIEWHYSLRNKELNMSNKYAEVYSKVLAQLADSNSFIPYSIGSSNWSYVQNL